ncbi:Mannose-6-phosphate receptor binding domain [Lasallia pustulata]|uniref:Mannose-6-phosphate receptor binding domain n=1 Tax=Lasallia pustulata TaxID=136370 RepID=A0A1W5D2M9_9LECA|nr:Mannose-6-phosphate receptor binding domain [Lasallia pustulata]
MRLPHLCACLSLLAPLPAWAADSKSPAPLKPCTIYSATSGSFFDLNALSVQPPKEGKKAHKDDRTESWHAKGYDYQTNFTLNFCAPVVEDLDDVVGVDNDAWRNQTLGPGAVFGVIALIAVAVYLVGGCVYQRNVMHQRGWRQLPNYAIWAGVGAFVRDVFIIATSACARLVPRRRGYSQLSGGRGRSSDDENRLIDQLDEDWDD